VSQEEDNKLPMETIASKKYIICFFPSSVSVTVLITNFFLIHMFLFLSLFGFVYLLPFIHRLFIFLATVSRHFYSLFSLSSIVAYAYFILWKQLKYGGSN